MPYVIYGTIFVSQGQPSFEYDVSSYKYVCDDRHLLWLDPGRRINEEASRFLRSAVCNSGRKSLPDIFGITSAPCISKTLKDVIENLEPETHQFFPVQIKSKKGFFDEECFVFNVCKTRDYLDLERSDFVIGTNLNGQIVAITQRSLVSVRTLKQSQDIDCHVWRDRGCLWDIYISDAVYQNAKKAGVKGLNSSHVSTVAIS